MATLKTIVHNHVNVDVTRFTFSKLVERNVNQRVKIANK